MTVSSRSFLKDQLRAAGQAIRRGWDVLVIKGPSQFQFWLIALFIGIAAGLAASLFRKSVNALQGWAYGTDNVAMLHGGVIQWTGPVADMDQSGDPYLDQFISGRAEGPIEAVR